jgi:ArsR family transcriptional regulator
MARPARADDALRLRSSKADFFRALAHPTRIAIVELLRDGQLTVTEIGEALGTRGSAVSQQLAILRARGIVEAERSGTTVRYRVPDQDVYVLLDAGRRIFYGRLADTVDLLRLVESEGSSRDA